MNSFRIPLPLWAALILSTSLISAQALPDPPTAPVNSPPILHPVDSMLERARRTNADLLRARSEYEAALNRIPQAGSLPDPRIELEYMGNQFAGSAQSVRLAQSFPWPGTRAQRRSAASLQARAYWHEIQQMELQLVTQIRTLIVEHSFLAQQIELIGSNQDLYQKQEAFLEQTVRTGGGVSDLLRVEMEAGLLADDVHRLREEQKRLAASLAAWIGDSDPMPMREPLVKLSDTLEFTPSGHSEEHLRTHNPILQALASRIEAAEAGVQLARLETRPEWMVGAGYRYALDPAMSMPGRREFMDEGVVMLSVSIPLWRAKNRGIREEAASRVEIARQEHEAQERRLKAQLHILRSRERDALRRIDLFDTVLLPKARQTQDAIESAYRSGSGSLLDLFEARRRLLETETGYWRALTDLHINRIEQDALFGTEIQISQP